MIISAEEFVALRGSRQQDEYIRAANDSASMEVWLDVIDRFPDLRIWVAHNKTVPVEVLALLARDSDPEVRASVAMKNRLSYELFILLAADSDDSVRERIVHNKNTPPEVLRQLSRDSSENVSTPARERVRQSA
jgi:hypothetical protein